jgi:hypothetical protein
VAHYLGGLGNLGFAGGLGFGLNPGGSGPGGLIISFVFSSDRLAVWDLFYSA